MRRSCLKDKVDDGQMDRWTDDERRRLHNGISFQMKYHTNNFYFYFFYYFIFFLIYIYMYKQYKLYTSVTHIDCSVIHVYSIT